MTTGTTDPTGTTDTTGPTSDTTAPYRSDLPLGRDGFAPLLHSEWTKLRTVRGWVVALVAAAVVTVLVAQFAAMGTHRACIGPSGQACTPYIPPVGPGGETVNDRFYFVHQNLDGDGSITVRVTSLTGASQSPAEPWAKAGLIVKDGTTQGSAYAAIMVTGGHGVRMQYDYTHDAAGSSGLPSAASPRWLRLTRTGDTVTGYESADGTRWSQVGTARLAGLPSTVAAGLFVTSPDHAVTTQRLGGSSSTSGPTQATADFGDVSLQGRWPDGMWRGADTAGGDGGPGAGPDAGFTETDGAFELTGSGDIAPAVAGPEGNTIEQTQVGAFAGMILVIVLGAMFVTAEYRRGLIRTTLAASPRRGQVLAAKAVVLGAVTFVAGLASATVAFWWTGKTLRANGIVLHPVTWLTELRVIAGTAALLAVAAVFALAVGAVLRRSAGAVAAVVVLVILPYILAVAAVVPVGPAQWLLRVTPAAGFAIQQSVPQYPQVDAAYTPANGYFPLAPWGGFAVLCAWAALALGVAVVLIRRRDA